MLKDVWSSLKPVLEPVGKALSSIVNFVLLGLVYFIGIGVVSTASKLFRKHFLELKKTDKKSNWHEHRVEKQPLEKYYRTF